LHSEEAVISSRTVKPGTKIFVGASSVECSTFDADCDERLRPGVRQRLLELSEAPVSEGGVFDSSGAAGGSGSAVVNRRTWKRRAAIM
jgi:hypothetical protein